VLPPPTIHGIPGLPPDPPSAPSSAERLARLAKRVPDLAALLARVERSPDPDLCLGGLERYLDGAGELPPEPDLLDALLLLCGTSRMLPSLLAKDPRLLRRAARSRWLGRPRPESDLRRLLARAARRLDPDDVAGLHRLLRRLRAREVVRIALRDLRRARVREVTDELSGLATACLDAAIRFHDRRLRLRHGPPAGLEAREPGAGFCALAMGKLGAHELNFSSDIDLIYVYERDGQTEGPRPVNHFAYFAKLAELVTESLAKPTEDGFVFRVDLNLRPDGQNGPIVNSVRAAELYYQSFGRTWERAALVKARPAAGDQAVGEEILAALEPFIWRRSLDLSVLEEIQSMKARIDARAGAEGRDDLKLGKGGIREAEFFVTALQLLHGGREDGKALRERAVLPALDRLLFAGVVPARDRDELADAYLFLRRAEHRIQMLDGAQLHRLPAPGERKALARSMGYVSEAAFEAALTDHRERTQRLFGSLLGTAAEEAPLDPELTLLADPDVERGRRLEMAATRGFLDPDRIIAAIDAMARRATPFSRQGDPVHAASLLSDALGTPDPDQAVAHLGDFATALGNCEPYFRLMRENRRVARLLLSLFGTSDFLSKRFVRTPELFDLLMGRRQVVLEKARDQMQAELLDRLRPPEGDHHPDEILEMQLGAVRRFKDQEILRIAVHDIAGAIDLPAVARQLTELAEVCLEACLEMAEAEARAKGRAPEGRLCVIGMGKLGGRELGYHSDLDLIFVYPGDASAHERYARLTQRFLSFLQMPLREGRLYQIDTRLRPSGNQGALVIGVEGFIRYHTGAAVPGGGARGDAPGEVRSQLWERQALLRARHVAGDPAPFEELQRRAIVPAVYTPRGDRAAMAEEIRRMRERMETELSQEVSRGRNPKTGYGGVVDVEFAAQFLQLVHGHDHPEVRTGSTPEALARLRAAGLLREPAYQALAGGYQFLRRVELRLRIVHDYEVAHLPPPGPALDQLARRLGYGGPEAAARFLAEYDRTTGAIRSAFEEVVV
jgi:[glutamine synthetase] adenylyltransferase / [glutamine synthetase]-adenylyl-L-tyrosine phosphorylase